MSTIRVLAPFGRAKYNLPLIAWIWRRTWRTPRAQSMSSGLNPNTSP